MIKLQTLTPDAQIAGIKIQFLGTHRLTDRPKLKEKRREESAHLVFVFAGLTRRRRLPSRDRNQLGRRRSDSGQPRWLRRRQLEGRLLLRPMGSALRLPSHFVKDSK